MVKYVLSHNQVIDFIHRTKKLTGNEIITHPRYLQNKRKIKFSYSVVDWFNVAVGIEILYFLMRRISECVEMKIEHIDYETETVIFPRTKTEPLIMRAPVHVIQDLRTVAGDRSKGYLWPIRRLNKPGHWHKNSFNDCIQGLSIYFGFGGIIGKKPIKDCGKCEFKRGKRCSRHGDKWISAISTKICERENRVYYVNDFKIHSHTFRASAATTLLKAGYSVSEVMRWGGWETYSAFKRYVVLSCGDELPAAWKGIPNQLSLTGF